MFEEFKGTEIPIPTPKKPSGDFLKKLPKIVLIVVIVLVLLAVVASSWYTVNDKEQAVVTTFGKVTDIIGCRASTLSCRSAFRKWKRST